jgi:hypothetical protein
LKGLKPPNFRKKDSSARKMVHTIQYTALYNLRAGNIINTSKKHKKFMHGAVIWCVCSIKTVSLHAEKEEMKTVGRTKVWNGRTVHRP